MRERDKISIILRLQCKTRSKLWCKTGLINSPMLRASLVPEQIPQLVRTRSSSSWSVDNCNEFNAWNQDYNRYRVIMNTQHIFIIKIIIKASTPLVINLLIRKGKTISCNKSFVLQSGKLRGGPSLLSENFTFLDACLLLFHFLLRL